MIFLILFNIFKKVSVSKQFRILSSYQNIILRLYCMCSNDPFKYLVSCQFAIFIKRADEFSPIIRACKLFIESMSSNFFIFNPLGTCSLFDSRQETLRVTSVTLKAYLNELGLCVCHVYGFTDRNLQIQPIFWHKTKQQNFRNCRS